MARNVRKVKKPRSGASARRKVSRAASTKAKKAASRIASSRAATVAPRRKVRKARVAKRKAKAPVKVKHLRMEFAATSPVKSVPGEITLKRLRSRF